MMPQRLCVLTLGILLTAVGSNSAFAEEPSVLEFSVTNNQQQIRFGPYPSAESYKIFRADSLGQPFVEDSSGAVFGFAWNAPLRTDALGFYKVGAIPMANNELLASIVLNRLAYGPTPDELERVMAMGPDAYIAEQLAPELIQEQLPADAMPRVENGWRYITATGNGSSSTLYVFLTQPGDGYIDDIKLVSGSVPEVGANLIRNGDFEVPLSTNDWTISTNHTGSAITTSVKHSGTSSLQLMATVGGTTQASSIWQAIRPALSASQQYTLSYWYLPGSNTNINATVRLSGDGILSSSAGGTPLSRLVANQAAINDLRSWHILRGVQSKRQLLEGLLQFLENHFVTEHSKAATWFDTYYDDLKRAQEAVNLDFRENKYWRQALLNPQCTFYDLLKISAESPAMIIYLDTVSSAGNGTSVANENYARELLELFTFGVDNGYDQNDIVETSKAWTGWRVAMMNPANEFNPLAAPLFHPSNQATLVTNFSTGTWSFWYRADRHNNTQKRIFPGKTVPARFGPQYAGRNYELVLPVRTGTPNGGTNGIKDGYEIIAHLANQPFTQEFISVKLCRLFIHDDFAHGEYDYTDPNLAPEGKLIKQCMAAWENSSPKGQIRAVLATIFNSELFRGNAAAAQKVKTPLEFTVSAVRALRANANGTFTAETDGNLDTALNRMGSMRLFDRAEPDGFPESGPPWISAGTLSERLRWMQAFLIARGTASRPTEVNNNTYSDPVALLRAKLPQASWQNADAVADYFVGILYPGEGRANLDLYRKLAVDFLNTPDSGTVVSLLSGLATTGNPSPYDTRVRGMVAMLMTLPRFQEQ